MNYKEANSKSNMMLIIAIILFVGYILLDGWVLPMLCLLAGIVLIIASIVLRVKYSKCPHCKKKLSLGFHSEPDKCPHCKGILIKPEDAKK